MEMCDRIRQRREELGLTQEELAHRLEYKDRSTIAKIEAGINDLNQTKIAAFAKALETTTVWLMGDDAPRKENMERATYVEPLPDNVIPMPGTRQVPRLGAIACGEPILAEDNIEGYDEVPDWVKCDFTLECKGDSMINARIHDGDIVCIKAQPEVESGQIAAVLIDGEFESGATLKRVRYIEGGVALWPENPAYAPMVFVGAEAERVRILGLATHLIGKVV